MPKMKLVKSLPWLTKTGNNKITIYLIFWFLQRRCYKQRRHRYYFVVSWAASHWSAGDPDFFCNFSARVRSLSGLVTLTHWFTNLSNALKSWLIRPWLMKIPSCIVVDVLESADYSLETAVICIFTYWRFWELFGHSLKLAWWYLFRKFGNSTNPGSAVTCACGYVCFIILLFADKVSAMLTAAGDDTKITLLDFQNVTRDVFSQLQSL